MKKKTNGTIHKNWLNNTPDTGEEGDEAEQTAA